MSLARVTKSLYQACCSFRTQNILQPTMYNKFLRERQVDCVCLPALWAYILWNVDKTVEGTAVLKIRSAAHKRCGAERQEENSVRSRCCPGARLDGEKWSPWALGMMDLTFLTPLLLPWWNHKQWIPAQLGPASGFIGWMMLSFFSGDDLEVNRHACSGLEMLRWKTCAALEGWERIC